VCVEVCAASFQFSTPLLVFFSLLFFLLFSSFFFVVVWQNCYLHVVSLNLSGHWGALFSPWLSGSNKYLPERSLAYVVSFCSHSWRTIFLYLFFLSLISALCLSCTILYLHFFLTHLAESSGEPFGCQQRPFFSPIVVLPP